MGLASPGQSDAQQRVQGVERVRRFGPSTYMQILFLIVLGVAAGVLSGLVGIGGGILLVPGLVFLIGLTQHQAQGTTLALMVPPVGIVAAWAYWRQGYVDLRIAALIGLGFVIGTLWAHVYRL